VEKLSIPAEKLPVHVAIVMDGNGRWAKKRGLPRTDGHLIGMEKIRYIMELCRDRGIKILTLYAFSQQNWNRSLREVRFLMKRFEEYLDREFDNLMEKGIRLRVIGRVKQLPSNLRKKIHRTMVQTKTNRDFFLNLAINYGGAGGDSRCGKDYINPGERRKDSPSRCRC